MIIIPKKILYKVLMYSSLYGPSSNEPAKHSLIGAVNLHIKPGRIQTFTKKHPVMSSMAHITFLNSDIKGNGEICIGEVCKIIGGRDEQGNSWKSVWERLSDPISLTVDKNTVILNKDQSYELSVSLIKKSIAEATNIEPAKFTTRITEENDTGYLLKDGNRIGSIFRIMGSDLKSIIDDEKGMPSDYFEFSVNKNDQKVLSMNLGNTSRSSRRKIDLHHVDLKMGIIEASLFNGLEAFANAIVSDQPFDIYFDQQKNKFTLYQSVNGEQLTYLEGGATIGSN